MGNSNSVREGRKIILRSKLKEEEKEDGRDEMEEKMDDDNMMEENNENGGNEEKEDDSETDVEENVMLVDNNIGRRKNKGKEKMEREGTGGEELDGNDFAFQQNYTTRPP